MINSLKWAWKLYFESKKKSYPLVNYGVKLLLGVPSLIGGLNIALRLMFNEKFLVNNVEFTMSEISDISIAASIIFIIIGIILIGLGIKTAREQSRKTSRVLIVSMLESSAHFPNNILYESEKIDLRETIELGLPENNDYVKHSIEMFNAEQMVGIYHRFILNHECRKVFLGGRARIPFLVAYGACFRNASAEIVYFDQRHQNGKWQLLNEEDQDVSLQYEDIDNLEPNNDGDVGIAIGFSLPVKKHQLPDYLKNNTLFVTSSGTASRNLINNQDNLLRISNELKTVIDKLSVKESCQRIHFFLAVQTSLALELGRNYQEGTHKNWIMHNYNPERAEYEWAIELNSNGMVQKFI